jgi:hypothetical protein
MIAALPAGRTRNGPRLQNVGTASHGLASHNSRFEPADLLSGLLG